MTSCVHLVPREVKIIVASTVQLQFGEFVMFTRLTPCYIQKASCNYAASAYITYITSPFFLRRST